MAKKAPAPRSRGQMIPKGENKWLLRVYLGRDENGKRLYDSQTFIGSQREASVELGKMQARRDTNTHVKPNDYTVASFWPVFLAEKRNISDNTRGQYATRAKVDILNPKAGLADVKLSDLEPSAVSRWVTWMQEKGHSARTVRYSYTLLHGMYELAMAWGYVPRNPVKATLPAQEHREQETLTAEEQVRLLDTAEAHGDPLAALWAVLLLGGLRPQEALALTWADLAGSRLTINKAVVQAVDKKTGQKKWTIGAVKTAKGRGTITLPRQAVEALRAHQQRTGGIGTSLIFRSASGQLLDRPNVAKAWKRACKRAGVPVVRLYDTRHTNATTLLLAGVPLKVVSERLRHSSIAITGDVYSHVLPEMDAGAADELEEVLQNARGRMKA